MEPDYWQQRWAAGRVGWHQPKVNALLRQYWPALAVPAGDHVFVPLCGKSMDIAWLAEQGHNVLGVELSAGACAAFFAENGWRPEVATERSFQRFRRERIELLAGNVFDLGARDLAHCSACYDRAALIALPASMRQDYADNVLGKLPGNCRMLLITLEYPQQEKTGPPFSVELAEVERLFATHWRVELLERRDILAHESGFKAEGVTQLHTAAYRLVKATTC